MVHRGNVVGDRDALQWHYNGKRMLYGEDQLESVNKASGTLRDPIQRSPSHEIKCVAKKVKSNGNKIRKIKQLIKIR